MPLLDPQGEYIQEHWRNRVRPMAAERGLVMNLPPAQTRTRRAHEAAAFARAHGRFAAVDRGIFRAFFEHGRDINDVEVLAAIAEEAGLDPAALRAAVESREFAPLVEADAALAHQLRIRSVPVMLVTDDSGRAEPVLGAVPFDDLERAVRRTLQRNDELRGVRPG